MSYFMTILYHCIVLHLTLCYVKNHFVQYNEMVGLGSNAKRVLAGLQLSRYACYLIIQNANPSKEIVAAGQTYKDYMGGLPKTTSTGAKV
ncbi:MAG: hypothetical protein A2487_18005 [Candidatus Raymondbacteria bacterium RifOxyC12_full_50_8]|uniref:Uncharacterized protein n=1 Tax=Candidatus Raymondbacteria bacterium RIFOXYD12_FULL_49_13 TaxID=1817890 RepID=A0A1F7FGM9_UNCRA|nr:MAG: hypothetical protein A2248_05005 [Candidatus Raymondbacteria bacterium RIFOXYA2_FULL_49_16]OGJ99262.1 MAG: hypothetical protein A2350_05305 [Candidatus Raymondbacteria bacterium RifOxyB12_full_50_8]OGK04746.1 MAG: hypothetical protein A2487_18005 [Candidatus Raymondbacteria bacterium RifOxyC12_full_50_8]OGK05854.1 MAG: hypothetical protein A2519_04180 [Candidatus Raymondbacteria bacterium RIFOXYD12_FULL_49_13]OGP43348.1 MAG: hypothetical protein A2324_02645 [Candidatus Raymondbacteria b